MTGGEGLGRLGLFVVLVLLAPSVSVSSVPPSILLLGEPGQSPSTDAVGAYLSAPMKSLGVMVREMEVEGLPTSQVSWGEIVRRKGRRFPGILAVFGWTCPSQTECYLVAVEPKRQALVSFPVTLETTSEMDVESGDEARSTSAVDGDNSFTDEPAVAAIGVAIREVLLGNLLVELPRVIEQAEHPMAAPLTDQVVPAVAVARTPEPKAAAPRAKMALELGYSGAHLYPAIRPVHGVIMGAAFAPDGHLVPTLHVGWRGMGEQSGPAGLIRTGAIPITASLRIGFDVGPTSFNLEPMIQAQLVHVRKKPVVGDKATVLDVDFSVGGFLLWRLPMPRKGVFALLGAGILATVLSDDQSIQGERIMEGTSFQFLWTAGLGVNLY